MHTAIDFSKRIKKKKTKIGPSVSISHNVNQIPEMCQ